MLLTGVIIDATVMRGRRQTCQDMIHAAYLATVYIRLFNSRMKGGVSAAKRISIPYSKARRASALNTHGVFMKTFPRGMTDEDLVINTQLLFHL